MAQCGFIVGNTYRSVPLSEAKLDRSGRFHKEHDWTLFVDVVSGNPDLIERVVFDLGSSFSPSSFVCASPVSVTRPNGLQAWRFSTRQQTYGAVKASIKIRGMGGTVLHTEHRVVLHPTSSKPPVQFFNEPRPAARHKPLKLPDQQRFGIELELTSPPRVSLDAIVARIPIRVNLIDSYGEGRATTSDWKMVPDSSIVCSASIPDCNKFELVSPVLQGGNGLGQVNQVLNALGEIEPKLKVNKSMGFHVHVDVSTLSHAQLIKVCQNFIKYEDVLDRLQPLSRRTGSAESNQFFQSNRSSVESALPGYHGGRLTNKQRHEALAVAQSTAELVKMMNYEGRYYKLNLQNLSTGRQRTIEFRQHAATMNYEKVSSWVRFCVAFVTNSAKLATPSPFASNRSVEFQFKALFEYVIKDRALRDFYLHRFEHLGEDDNEEPCCTACAMGGACAANKRRRVISVGYAEWKNG